LEHGNRDEDRQIGRLWNVCLPDIPESDFFDPFIAGIKKLFHRFGFVV
jgi:hypothetical protein